ncbi:MAG: hypothetical protein KIB42_06765 [Varibaculum cambriense]|uniref:hypothetical protein n=1 Tax=Varibaculum cambriense TaxID=184870 RepID=UPI001EB9B8E9|nr:hypothetical protein [Varibaculum cambriense]MBS5919313.1 hypothetical protein [Varibaculum cambriense]
MPARKKPVEDLGRSVAAVLQEKTKTLGLSYRAVAEAAGMSLNRVGIIFRNEGSTINVDEIVRMATALSLRPSQVVAEAEKRISGSFPSASAPGASGSGAGKGASDLGAGNVARPDFGRGKSRKVSEDLEELEPFA